MGAHTHEDDRQPFSASDALAQIVHQFRGHKVGNQWMVCCPAHDDRSPSLAIRMQDQKLLVHCHAGCPQSAVIQEFQRIGLWPDSPDRDNRRRRITATYSYTDEAGVELYQICRYEPGKDGRAKDFLQRHRDPNTGQRELHYFYRNSKKGSSDAF